MLPAAARRALKEWAVVVEALREGGQVLLLRKGGLHERGGEFRAAERHFLLFPTFEHQRREHLRPEAAERHAALLDARGEEGPVRFSVAAELLEDIPLVDPARARLLASHHVWSEAFVEMRIAYKPEKPLHVLLLRSHSLPRTVEVARHPRYAGCRSWVELEEEVPLEGARPVLAEENLERRLAVVRHLLR